MNPTTNEKPEQKQDQKRVLDLLEELRMVHDLLLCASFPLRAAQQALRSISTLQVIVAHLETLVPKSDAPTPQTAPTDPPTPKETATK